MTAFTREIEAKLEGIAEPLHQVQFLLRELSALEARFAASLLRAETAEERVRELEATLEAIARRGPIMGSTDDYRLGQLHALDACATVARSALQSAAAKGGEA